MTRQRPLTTVLAALGALIALVILLFPLYAVIIGVIREQQPTAGHALQLPAAHADVLQLQHGL